MIWLNPAVHTHTDTYFTWFKYHICCFSWEQLFQMILLSPLPLSSPPLLNNQHHQPDIYILLYLYLISLYQIKIYTYTYIHTVKGGRAVIQVTIVGSHYRCFSASCFSQFMEEIPPSQLVWSQFTVFKWLTILHEKCIQSLPCR